MKFRLSLSLKFALSVLFIIILLVTSLYYVNMMDQNAYFEANTKQNVYMYVQLLDNDFRNISFLKDYSKTSEAIGWFMSNNPKVQRFCIFAPTTDRGKLRILASSDESMIGGTSEYGDLNAEILDTSIQGSGDYYLLPSYYEVIEPSQIYYERIGESYDYVVVCAIPADDASGYIGTYELIVSMEDEFVLQNQSMNNIRNVSLFFLIASVIIAFAVTKYEILK